MNAHPAIAFFGTDEFSVAALSGLAECGITPALIVTAPDKPRGRGRQLSPAPAKQWARERGISALQPERLDSGFLSALESANCDLFLVASYGKILPKALLGMPRHGTLNIHPSLLPKLRGPAPVQAAILADEKGAVGVTIMLVDEEMDHGPILAQEPREIAEWPSAGALQETLARAGAALFAEMLPRWLTGALAPRKQDHAKATYTQKLGKADCRTEPESGAAYEAFRRIQACTPRPGAHFFAGGTRVKITEAAYEADELAIRRVIPEGRREMDYADFKRNLERSS